ncbi:MAG: division/cell wall cluster transcriptional repressor MraZ [Planctomycetes bacterium]|nr:division/cell wall cluster transcriptional repressor MraZ [Planctomycetota bacterium]
MAFFTGQSEHKLDSKGRLFLPRRIVEAVDDPAERSRFVITAGPERCLYVFTPSGFARHFRQVQRQVRGQPGYSRVMRGMSRLLSEQTVDGQGRMLIPGELRQHAGLTRETVVVGVFEHVEIWDAGSWAEATAAEAEAAYLHQAADFFNGGSPDPDEERP